MKRISKVFKTLSLFLIVFLITGCVQSETTMEISKDKSMTLTITEVFDSTSIDEFNNQFTKEKKEEFEKNGFYVENYSANGNEGIKITKKVKNIDDVSTEATISKEEMTKGLTNADGYMFTIKRGFFKDTYKATYSLENANDLGSKSYLDKLNDNSDSYLESVDDNYDETCLYTKEDSNYIINCGADPVDDQESNRAAYQEMMENRNSQMNSNNLNSSIVFKLKLPYKALSSNATSKSNNGKELVWDLTEQSDITFEFAIYDMTRIYIAIGAGVLIFLFLLASLSSKNKRKRRKKKSVEVSNLGGETKGFINQMDSEPKIEESNINETVETNDEIEQPSNKFITYEDVVKESKIEDTPTISEIYDNIPVIDSASAPNTEASLPVVEDATPSVIVEAPKEINIDIPQLDNPPEPPQPIQIPDDINQ